MWRDAKDAFRGFGRTPAFTAAATLALGIAVGANATIFSLVDGLWLRPPAVSQPGRVVRLFQTTPESAEGLWSWPEYEALRDRATTLSGVVAIGRRGALMADTDGTPELLLVNAVSLDFFTVLGVTAGEGRLFAPSDAGALEAEPGIVLGHAFWRRRFGADPSIVGRRVTLGVSPGRPVTVLGVLPDAFRELDPASDRDIWMPVTTWTALHGREELAGRGNRWFQVVGRLAPSASAGAAASEIRALTAAFATDWPDTNAGRSARVVTDLSYRLSNGGANVYALMGLVLVVVLITCVNLAHLLLARAAARRRELALRAALGAGRRHLLRQLLVEAAVLGGFGAVAGLIIGAWLIRALPWFIVPAPGFRAFELFRADGRVVLFSLAVTALTTLLFGLAPAFSAARTRATALLKGGAGLTGSARADRTLGRVLVVAQIAVSLALVYSAAVLAQSFRAVERTDLGFSRAPRLTAWIPYGDLPAARLEEGARAVAALPGVTRVAVAIRAPLSLSGGGLATTVVVPGAEASTPPDVKYGAVSANYFDAMGVRILRGRGFTEAESHGGEPVAVVSQTFADRFFPGGEATGQVFQRGASRTPVRVVGVAADAAIVRVDEGPEPYFYVPYWTARTGEGTLLVEGGGDVAALGPSVRATLRATDASLEPRLLVTMAQYLAFAAGAYRTTAALAGTLGLIGLFLMAIGIYGVTTYQTTRRTREIGVRLAIGATRAQVMRLVLGDGGRLVVAGLAIGIPLAFVAGWTMTSLLFGVSPWSMVALGVAAAILVCAVFAATVIPAWRAARLSPSVALREG
ncbi:MAG: ADOP family duplicated permease [Vicinamibacterales bacterium]